jgi:mono/diheme cytochrome c family protein
VIRPTIAALGALGFAALVGCRGQASQDSPIVGIRGMYDQPRYDMQAKSDFFADKRTMRLPVANTVAREAELDPELSTGRLVDDTGYVLAIPKLALDRAGAAPGANEEAKRTALLARGQERFNIYCAPCHDMTGSGHGMVVKHGMIPPPTFHQDRIRHMPDGQLFATISNGIRNMPAYGINVPVEDRWAIVSYVRALQVSQAPIASAKESQL